MEALQALLWVLVLQGFVLIVMLFVLMKRMERYFSSLSDWFPIILSSLHVVAGWLEQVHKCVEILKELGAYRRPPNA